MSNREAPAASSPMTTNTPPAAPITAEREAFIAEFSPRKPLWQFQDDGTGGFHNQATEWAWIGWQARARLSAPVATTTWEPNFDVCSVEQERLVQEFCAEIAGPRGQKGSPPDPVRLLEMARALYEAERKDLGPPPVAAQPADSATITLQQRVAELVEQHGSLRAAAKVLECDVGYLSRLASGEKDEPGDLLRRRMGLRRVVTFTRAAASKERSKP